MSELKVGDKVKVNDPGLIRLQEFAPSRSKPNNVGTVSEIWKDGTILVEFKLSGKNHSQAAPYPKNLVEKL